VEEGVETPGEGVRPGGDAGTGPLTLEAGLLAAAQSLEQAVAAATSAAGTATAARTTAGRRVRVMQGG